MPYPAYKSTLPVGRIRDVSIAIRHFSFKIKTIYEFYLLITVNFICDKHKID